MTAAGALAAALDRAERAGWAGADPYDALLSPMGRLAIPLGPFARVLATQAALRVPLFRSLSPSPRTINPKGLGLFLGALVRGREALGDERARAVGSRLVRLLGARAVPWRGGRAWGYPFPWQSRWFWAPAGTPNAVVTATVGWHALEYADAFGDPDAAALGRDAAAFLAGGLAATAVGDGEAALAYTPNDRTRIVNVSALGARLFARTGVRDISDQLLRFILAAQRPDGSWRYAEDPRGGWQDSFHTGFVLEALLDLERMGWDIPRETVTKGFEAYERFFDADGGARVFPGRDAPYDAHSAAQGILTYAALAHGAGEAVGTAEAARERALRIARWSLDRLWIPGKGHFAYRVRGGHRDEREYLRWVEAWMALAMSAAFGLERAAGDATSPKDGHGRAGKPGERQHSLV